MIDSFEVPLTTISGIKPHPNADRLEVAIVLGWQVVVGKGEFNEGDTVVYFPPDACLTVELATRLGIAQYLSHSGALLRTRSIKLRGEPSFGFAVPAGVFGDTGTYLTNDGLLIWDGDEEEEKLWFKVGDNLASELDVEKYAPPVRVSLHSSTRGSGQGSSRYGMCDHPQFGRYPKMKNLRYYPHDFDGEEVYVTEKIHGTNVRYGSINGVIMAGSMNIRRAELRPGSPTMDHFYWLPHQLPEVRNLIYALTGTADQVIIFGETFGPQVQGGYSYGQEPMDVELPIGFRAFDISIDGKFVSPRRFQELCYAYGIYSVPVLYKGKYTYDGIVEQAEAFKHSNMPGAEQTTMEGVVVKVNTTEIHPRLGRQILKYHTNTYLLDKRKSDYTEE